MQVKIRPWQKTDNHQLATLANNFNIWKNLRDRIPHPYLLKDADEWIEFTLQQQPLTDFAIETDGLIAGAIGCIIQSDIYRKNIEIGYFIGEAFWGKGIASEAVKQFLNVLQQQFNGKRIYAGVFETNKASMRVLEKNGFHLEAIHKQAVYKNNCFLDEHVWVKLL